MIRVKDIKISITSNRHDIRKAVARKLAIFPNEVLETKIVKKSIDARKKDNILFTYTIDAKVADESLFPDLIVTEKESYPEVENNRTSNKRPVIVGAGPAGLFAGLLLAKEGTNPIIIEQGKKVEDRKKDVDEFFANGKLNLTSNIQFGEGGAGTFSDGKLTTLTNNPLSNFVIDEFIKAGAPEEIKYEAKPHVGTDNLMTVVKNIREEIISLGGEVLFEEKVTDIICENNKVSKVVTKSGKEFETDAVIFAIGHSSRDTFEMLRDKKTNMEPKAFSVGFRIEHKQSEIDKIQYGPFAGNEQLGPADYKLAYHGEDGRGTYTFCMCPGGAVVASASEEGRIVTNGMSNYKRDGENANSAILVSVSPEDFEGDDVLRGMYYQRKLEEKAFELGGSNYNAPVQRVVDYMNNTLTTSLGKVTPTYKPGYKFANLNEIFDEKINKNMKEGLKYMGKRIKGFDGPDAILTGVETRSSSPVRILRNEKMQSSIDGMYPAGEGAGYAGGIMSAAVDGLRVALAILKN